MRRKKIDYETILACKAGDGEALKRVLEHYDGLINAAASKMISDEFGNQKLVVDPEIKQNIQQNLMLQIYMNYDHLAGPPDCERSQRA